MTTLTEIESAVDALPTSEKLELYRYFARQLDAASSSTPMPQHSVLDIAPVRLGSILRPLTSDDDLLGEMLEGRP